MISNVFRRTALCAAILVLASPVSSQDLKLGGGYEKYAEEHAFAADVLRDLNSHSVFVDLEFCGFIYRANGELRATSPEKGEAASCLPILPQGNVEVFASYHTHAAFDPASFNEYPSVQDMEGDFSRFENGYISTPGGRLWFVDNQKRRARQLCGYRCMPFDPHYRESPAKPALEQVTIETLNRIFDQGIEY